MEQSDKSEKPHRPHGPLWKAIKKGDLSEVEKLVALGGADAIVKQRDDKGSTPLHYAVAHAKEDIVRCLISTAGVRIDVLDAKGRTPLYLACAKKRKSIAVLLAEKGADIYSVTAHGKAVMTKAQHLGKRFIYDLRVAAKENPSAEEGLGTDSDVLQLIQENINLIDDELNSSAESRSTSPRASPAPLSPTSPGRHASVPDAGRRPSTPDVDLRSPGKKEKERSDSNCSDVAFPPSSPPRVGSPLVPAHVRQERRVSIPAAAPLKLDPLAQFGGLPENSKPRSRSSSREAISPLSRHSRAIVLDMNITTPSAPSSSVNSSASSPHHQPTSINLPSASNVSTPLNSAVTVTPLNISTASRSSGAGIAAVSSSTSQSTPVSTPLPSGVITGANSNTSVPIGNQSPRRDSSKAVPVQNAASGNNESGSGSPAGKKTILAGFKEGLQKMFSSPGRSKNRSDSTDHSNNASPQRTTQFSDSPVASQSPSSAAAARGKRPHSPPPQRKRTSLPPISGHYILRSNVVPASSGQIRRMSMEAAVGQRIESSHANVVTFAATTTIAATPSRPPQATASAVLNPPSIQTSSTAIASSALPPALRVDSKQKLLARSSSMPGATMRLTLTQVKLMADRRTVYLLPYIPGGTTGISLQNIASIDQQPASPRQWVTETKASWLNFDELSHLLSAFVAALWTEDWEAVQRDLNTNLTDLVTANRVALSQLPATDMPIVRKNRLATILNDFVASIDLLLKQNITNEQISWRRSKLLSPARSVVSQLWDLFLGFETTSIEDIKTHTRAFAYSARLLVECMLHMVPPAKGGTVPVATPQTPSPADFSALSKNALSNVLLLQRLVLIRAYEKRGVMQTQLVASVGVVVKTIQSLVLIGENVRNGTTVVSSANADVATHIQTLSKRIASQLKLMLELLPLEPHDQLTATKEEFLRTHSNVFAELEHSVDETLQQVHVTPRRLTSAEHQIFHLARNLEKELSLYRNSAESANEGIGTAVLEHCFAANALGMGISRVSKILFRYALVSATEIPQQELLIGITQSLLSAGIQIRLMGASRATQHGAVLFSSRETQQSLCTCLSTTLRVLADVISVASSGS